MKRFHYKGLLSLLSVMHLIVDLICASTLSFAYFNGIHNSSFMYVFLIYNCVAFLSQPFLGLLMDKLNPGLLKAMMIFSSIFLIIGAYLTIIFMQFGAWTIVGAIFLGIGNALFHVVGGKEATSMSNKATPGGLFVSTGALGVGLGLMFYQNLGILGIIIIILPLIYAALCVWHMFFNFENDKIAYQEFDKSPRVLIIITIILCLAVGVRSFLGFFATNSENLTGVHLVFLLSVCAFLGKAIGGIILDLAGPYYLIGISTILGVVCGLLLKHTALDYIFVLSVNMLMPLTLDLVRRIFPKKEGFSFGLLAAFLIPGFLLAQILKGKTYDFSWVLVLLTGIMIISIYLILNKKTCEK